MTNSGFDKVFNGISTFFGILSHPDRVKILGILLKKEMDVSEICAELGLSQSRISQHLKLLKTNSLVQERREGKHVYYHIKDTRLSRVVESAIQFQIIGMTADPETINILNELFTYWHI